MLRSLRIWWLRRQLKKHYERSQRFHDIESWSLTKAEREFNLTLAELKAMGDCEHITYIKKRDGS